MDQLSTILILSKRLTSGYCHGMTMPWTWFLNQADRFDILSHGRHLQLLLNGFYLKNMPQLLEQIFTGQGPSKSPFMFNTNIV